MKRHPLALSALVLTLTFSIVGCAPESGTNATPPADRSSPASEPLPGETHIEPAQPSAPADEAGEVASTDRPDTADAKDASTIIPTTQIVVGTASIEVKNVSESLDSLTSWVQAQSGRISSSELYGDKGTTGGRATVRIPAERYEALVDHIQSMGELTHISSKSDDVGQQIADVDGRIKALETSVARLTDLMKNATNTADLVAAEKELTARQAELDSLKSQQLWLKDQVAYSTLEVNFAVPDGSIVEPTPNEWQRSWENFTEGMYGLYLAFVFLLPWLVILAIVVAAIIFGVRFLLGRKKRAVAAISPSIDEGGAESVKSTPERTAPSAHTATSESDRTADSEEGEE